MQLPVASKGGTHPFITTSMHSLKHEKLCNASLCNVCIHICHGAGAITRPQLEDAGNWTKLRIQICSDLQLTFMFWMDSTIFEEGAFNSAIVLNYWTTYFEKKPLIPVGTYTKNSPFQTPSTIAAMAAPCRCSGVLCPEHNSGSGLPLCCRGGTSALL